MRLGGGLEEEGGRFGVGLEVWWRKGGGREVVRRSLEEIWASHPVKEL